MASTTGFETWCAICARWSNFIARYPFFWGGRFVSWIFFPTLSTFNCAVMFEWHARAMCEQTPLPILILNASTGSICYPRLWGIRLMACGTIIKRRNHEDRWYPYITTMSKYDDIHHRHRLPRSRLHTKYPIYPIKTPPSNWKISVTFKWTPTAFPDKIVFTCSPCGSKEPCCEEPEPRHWRR